MKLFLIRHGITEWNAEKRIQGQTDTALSDEGIREVRARVLPESLLTLDWYCSPLRRARQTVELMGIDNAQTETALREMNWGEWEGKILKPLRRELGDAMRDNEARGLDFQPPGGESPRQVQARVRKWLQAIALRNDDCAAVTHKGVIRCLYALATNWDMRGDSPIQFDWQAVHILQLTDCGELLPHYSICSMLGSH